MVYSYYVHDQRIYYAKRLAVGPTDTVMIGAGYNHDDIARTDVALFPLSNALKIEFPPLEPGFEQGDVTDEQRLIGFHQQYAHKSDMAVTAAMWFDCRIANKFDVLHLLDPLRVGHACILTHGAFYRPAPNSLYANINFVDVALRVETPVGENVNGQARLANPFFENTARATEFNLTVIASAICLDGTDAVSIDSHVRLLKHHPTLIAIAETIRHEFEEDNLFLGCTHGQGVQETNFASLKGEYTVCSFNDFCVTSSTNAICFVFRTPQNTFYPPETAVLHFFLSVEGEKDFTIIFIECSDDVMIERIAIGVSNITEPKSSLFELAATLQPNLSFLNGDLFAPLDDADTRDLISGAIAGNNTLVADAVEASLGNAVKETDCQWHKYPAEGIAIKSLEYTVPETDLERFQNLADQWTQSGIDFVIDFQNRALGDLEQDEHDGADDLTDDLIDLFLNSFGTEQLQASDCRISQ